MENNENQKVETKETEKKTIDTSLDDEKKPASESIETKQEQVEQNTEGQEDGQPAVQDTTAVGNGLSIDDLATKADLSGYITKAEFDERLSALEAKYQAAIKESQDKDEKIKELTEKANGLENKFINNGDFGGESSAKVKTDDAQFETFDSYSAKFM